MNCHVKNVRKENNIERNSMDISKFNQELAYKVAKANGLEKHQRFKEAVEVWIEITEMVIRMSKLPKLDFSFRSMLIEKTEQIIKHIKDLKQISSQRIKKQSHETVKTPPSKSVENQREKGIFKITDSKIPSPNSIEEQKNPELSKTEKSMTDTKQMKFIESDDIENLPKGFKEIETSEDFTIITPHDKEYVEKILSQDIDMSVFKHPESDMKEKPNERFHNEGKKADKLICFACGTKLPHGTKICPNCGSKLN